MASHERVMKAPASLAGLCSVFAAFACSGPAEPDPATGTAREAIINGTTVGDPSLQGHVAVGLKGDGYNGSGTLLTDRWVLTAAHVLSQAQCPPHASMVLGNIGSRCRFDPKAQQVDLHQRNDNARQTQEVDRVSVHPRYVPSANENFTGIDVALVHTKQPLLAGPQFGQPGVTFPRTITNAPLTDLRGKEVDVFGYGQDVLGGGSGTLRQTRVTVTNVSVAPGIQTFDTAPLPGLGMTFSGDSGGPYFLPGNQNEVVGVHRGRVSLTFPPVIGIGIGAEGFRQWANLIMTSLTDTNAHMDFDGIPDSVMFRRVVMGGLPFVVVTILSSATGQAHDVFVIPDNTVPRPAFAFAAGDFNHDTTADIVGSYAGTLFYLQSVGNVPDAPITRPFPAQPALADYVNFVTGDFDGDQIEDLEATTDEGEVHVYYGSAGGLTGGLRAGRFTSTWPTTGRSDGRFALITGTHERTYPQPLFSGLAYVPPEEASLVNDIGIEVFDAPWGTGYDFGQGEVCYRVYGDPLCQTRKDDLSDIPPDPARLMAELSSTSTQFPENEWGKIYRGGSRTDIAKAASGALCYRFEAFMGPCSGPPVQGGDAIAANAFKVRFVSASPKATMGVDRGSAYWGRNFPSSDFHTDYDGSWQTFLEIGKEQTRFTLIDADADRADDENQPGQEIESLMFYELFHFDLTNGRGARIGQNQNPSGDYWEAGNHFDIEPCDPALHPNCTPLPGQNVFTFAKGAHPFVEWEWQDILNANMFYTDMQGSVMRRLAKPVQFRVSSSANPTTWISAPDGDIASLLPIPLGKLAACPGHPGQAGLVTTPDEARRILRKGSETGASKHDLEAQLLSAKLNVAHAMAIGEPLSSAMIYGSDTTVAEAIAEADAALSPHCPGTPANGNAKDDFRAIIDRLVAINAGQVTY